MHIFCLIRVAFTIHGHDKLVDTTRQRETYGLPILPAPRQWVEGLTIAAGLLPLS